MPSTATIEPFRQAAFNSAPGRLKRIVNYAVALRSEGVNDDDAYMAIQDALRAQGVLQSDRPSHIRAAEVVTEHALYGYDNAPDIIDMAAYRARRIARDVFDKLPDGATLKDFADALMVREPFLGEQRAMRAASDAVADLSRPPMVQRGPAPGPDPFAETRTIPDACDYARYRRALQISGTNPMGNLSDLRLATYLGEPVQPSAAEDKTGDIVTPRSGTFSPGVENVLRRALADIDDHLDSAADGVARSRLSGLLAGVDPALQSSTAPAAVVATPYVWIDPKTIPTRPWVFGHWLLRGAVTAIVAPGGVGKSTFTSAMALSLATGREILGQQVHNGPQRAWLWNLEDPRDEMQRSIQAAAIQHGIGPKDFAGRLFIDTAMDGKGLCTATEDRDGLKIVEPVYAAITAELKTRRIDILVVDPFVSSHEVEENANSKIDKIAKAWGRVANDANCAIVLVHHTSKAGAGEVTAMSARGAKALTDACRSVLTLNRMDDTTATKFGFDQVERRRYFAVNDDKHNRAPAADASWFRLVGVDLGNGGGNLAASDNVGVAVPWERPQPIEATPVDILAVQEAIAVGRWRESAQANAWAGKAVAHALGIDIGVRANKSRVKALLAKWIADGFLKVVDGWDDARRQRKFVEVGTPAPPATP